MLKHLDKFIITYLKVGFLVSPVNFVERPVSFVDTF
jgi:hypothetical protein